MFISWNLYIGFHDKSTRCRKSILRSIEQQEFHKFEGSALWRYVFHWPTCPAVWRKRISWGSQTIIQISQEIADAEAIWKRRWCLFYLWSHHGQASWRVLVSNRSRLDSSSRWTNNWSEDILWSTRVCKGISAVRKQCDRHRSTCLKDELRSYEH